MLVGDGTADTEVGYRVTDVQVPKAADAAG